MLVYDMRIIGSEKVATLLYLPLLTEPTKSEAEKNSEEGALIGTSRQLSMPVFISPARALNPHILVCGMTGGGKTYLTRSLITRLVLFSKSNAILIDFTGEYLSCAQDILATPGNLEETIMSKDEHSSYFDLHYMNEQEKLMAAHGILVKIATLMRKRDDEHKKRIFIVLDEAWKLVEDSRGLEVIIREGRKYGVGLVTSSQLLHDTSQTILSNVATVLVFRTTNVKSLERLSKSYNLSMADTSCIKELGRGDCMAIMQHVSGFKSAYVIEDVFGIPRTDIISITKGKKMEIKISVSEFDASISSLCGQDGVLTIRTAIKNGRIDLSLLVSILLKAGAERRLILLELNKMGFRHSDIADSFAIALSKIGVYGGKG
jgi:hypothetical protein